jgi:TRAP-type mannitol/chloroaromatic compound transport system permease small subunit
MDEKIGRAFKALDKFCEAAGIAVSLLAVVLMFLVVVSVFTRYVLNISFIWGLPLSRQIFGFFILFAALYALVTDSHLRVEILYVRFPRRIRWIADLIDFAAFALFVGVWIWQSGLIARNSISNMELTSGSPKLPLYVIKTIVPVMASLLFLQGVSSFYRHVKSRPEQASPESEKLVPNKPETQLLK